MDPRVPEPGVSEPHMLMRLVLAYVALLPYQFAMGNGINFAPADCPILLALFLAPGVLKYRGRAWSAWHFAIAATFAFGSFVAALRFGGLSRYELLNKDAGLTMAFLSYVAITSSIGGWSDLRRVIRVFVSSVALQNIVAVATFLAAYFFGIDDPFARYGGMRLSGLLLDPNAYGGLLACAFAACEGACVGPSPLFRPRTLWLFRGTLGMGLLFTFSRSAWIAFALALLLLSAIHIRAGIRLLSGGLICAGGVFLLLGQRFVPIFQEMASRPKQVQGRFDLIHDALQSFLQHPLVGGGIGSFRLGEGEIAHNSAMWFLADFGPLGLAALLGFVAWFWVKCWSTYRLAPPREQPLVLGLLLAHTAMFGLAMGIEAFYQRHWWLIMALIGAGYCLSRRNCAATGRNRSAEWMPYLSCRRPWPEVSTQPEQRF